MKLIKKIKEMRKKSMPESKKKMEKADIFIAYLIRPISDLITYPLSKTKIKPTTITKISAVFVILMFICFLLGFYYIGFVCLLVWDILDGVDGNLARYTDNCSNMGCLWDATTGWLAMFVFFLSMGLVAYREHSLVEIAFIPKYYYLIFGSLAAFGILFPRLVMHKKAGLLGEESVHKEKTRSEYSLAKNILLNLISINGLAFLIFVLATIFKLTNITMIFYLFICGVVGLGMLVNMLFKEN